MRKGMHPILAAALAAVWLAVGGSSVAAPVMEIYPSLSDSTAPSSSWSGDYTVESGVRTYWWARVAANDALGTQFSFGPKDQDDCNPSPPDVPLCSLKFDDKWPWAWEDDNPGSTLEYVVRYTTGSSDPLPYGTLFDYGQWFLYEETVFTVPSQRTVSVRAHSDLEFEVACPSGVAPPCTDFTFVRSAAVNAVVSAAVPEPGTLMLAVVGALALGGIARRARYRQS